MVSKEMLLPFEIIITVKIKFCTSFASKNYIKFKITSFYFNKFKFFPALKGIFK